ncbi:sorting nexin-7 isoform X1 [Halyomorpha halys]|uniref:sorting nexin-7 isoform X1 n=1 Tax=Halyomorpha halys TaxID=286706 RepID=UPI0006D4D427|nr:sorting nexin-7-like isoform X1 [Halyomorpha halys]
MCDDFQEYEVSVDNPQKHLDPMETYISFRVTTKVKQKSKEEEFIVRRRYSDFLWLRNKLFESFPTLVVPGLPAKHSVLEQLDRYSRPFIMTRMSMLHTFMQRVASHPVFSCSPVLKTFLTAKSAEFNMQAKAGPGLFDRLSGSIQNFKGYIPRHGHLYPEFEAVRVYVNNLSQKLSSLLSVSSRMHRERTELSLELEDAKRALDNWSYNEPELSQGICGVRKAIESVATLQKIHLLQTYHPLLENPLEEYLNYIEAVKEALTRRDAIQYNYENSIEETNKKRGEILQLEALNNNNGSFGMKLWRSSNREKLQKLKEEVPVLDRVVEENHDKVEIANESMKADLARWNTEKRSEIKDILNRITEQHVLYYEESLHAWEKALETLKGLSNSEEVSH